MVLWILLITLLILASWGSVTFDEVIKIEYNQYREVWEQSGHPRGVFWSEPELKYTFRGRVYQWYMLEWLFHTPAWGSADDVVRKLLKRFRLITLAFWLLIIILSGLLIF
jgi:hypothetical protein